MNGIASDTLNELRDVLSDCGPFGPEEGRTLSALFVETRLTPWRDAVPTADTRAGRIDALIDALHDQFNREGENVLHLFVRVLQERADEDTRCFQRLGEVAGALAADPQQAACALLRQHRPLLVLDNVETAADTAQTLLHHRNGATALVTSRDRAVTATYGRPETVQVLPREDAMELLLEKTGAADEAAADTVCELLGDLPQAIKLAAGYINTYALSLAGYADLLRQSKLGESLHLKERRDLSVPVSFGLSWARLGTDAKQALAVLALDGGETTGAAAVAAGAGWDLGVSLVDRLKAWTQDSTAFNPDEARARRALGELVQRSLAERDGQRPGRARLHPLVRQYTREQLTNQQTSKPTNQPPNQPPHHLLPGLRRSPRHPHRRRLRRPGSGAAQPAGGDGARVPTGTVGAGAPLCLGADDRWRERIPAGARLLGGVAPPLGAGGGRGKSGGGQAGNCVLRPQPGHCRAKRG